MSPVAAIADILVFECRFTDGFHFYITIYDDGSPARIGREQGVGDKAQTYFDKVTEAWVIVEFVDDGTLPSTLTTVLRDGIGWHSRHTLATDGTLLASQQSGACNRRWIK
jgi:hypothetical protein